MLSCIILYLKYTLQTNHLIFPLMLVAVPCEIQKIFSPLVKVEMKLKLFFFSRCWKVSHFPTDKFLLSLVKWESWYVLMLKMEIAS